MDVTDTPARNVGIVTTASGSLNLRKGPGKSHPRIIYIPNGASVTILERDVGTPGWYRVEYGGHTGYVDASFITLSNGENEHPFAVTVYARSQDEAREIQEKLRSIGLSASIDPYGERGDE